MPSRFTAILPCTSIAYTYILVHNIVFKTLIPFLFVCYTALLCPTVLNSDCHCRRQLHRWIYCFTTHKGQHLADVQWNLGFDWMSCWILLGYRVPALSCFFLLHWRRPAIHAMRVKSVFTAKGDVRGGLLFRCVCGCHHKCASDQGKLCWCD